MQVSSTVRTLHRQWLFDLTQLPTASGREFRVVRWIEDWCRSRPVMLTRDGAGNLHVAMRERPHGHSGRRPVYFTAHLDHPAFVVERTLSPREVQLSFRGGVMDEYFKDARVTLVNERDERVGGTLRGVVDAPGPFKHYRCELDAGAGGASAGAFQPAVGDVGVWEFPPAEIIDGCIHTQACDDLAAAAASLAAFDVLLERAKTQPIEDVRLLFTLAEEIGFVGAIAAAKGFTRESNRAASPTMPRDARVIALENSRSFPADSPIGGGPIVRVGDRLSIFSPTLTDAVAKRCEEVAASFGGQGTQPTASLKLSEGPKWKWQRKLMAGGACEASVFCHAGFEATCVCLPLGNYHNMADLAAVQAGTNATPPRVGREYVSMDDYHGLVDLLVACGERLPEMAMNPDRFDHYWHERKFVLDDATARV